MENRQEVSDGTGSSWDDFRFRLIDRQVSLLKSETSQKGWGDEEGVEIQAWAWDWVRAFLAVAQTSSFSANLPIPVLYPSPEGMIHVCWATGKKAFEFEFNSQFRVEAALRWTVRMAGAKGGEEVWDRGCASMAVGKDLVGPIFDRLRRVFS